MISVSGLCPGSVVCNGDVIIVKAEVIIICWHTYMVLSVQFFDGDQWELLDHLSIDVIDLPVHCAREGKNTRLIESEVYKVIALLFQIAMIGLL